MCQRYILATAIEKINVNFNVQASNIKDWSPPIVISLGQQSLIITQQNPTELTLSSFGMTPSWARYPMQLINARTEGEKNPDNKLDFRGSKAIFLKKAFRKPLFHQRCIVIADAFLSLPGIDYLPSEAKASCAMSDAIPEPATLSHSPSSKFSNPHLFFLKQHRHPIGLAGLYDIWHDNTAGENLHSFTIITVPANSLVRKIDVSRMPVILPYKLESRWLKQEISLIEILSRLEKYSSKEMDAYPVNAKIIQPGPHTKEILKPAGDFLNPDKPFEPIIIQSHYGHRKSKEDHGHWLGNKQP
jgi:putative SOS response-associated peptidase YedK